MVRLLARLLLLGLGASVVGVVATAAAAANLKKQAPPRPEPADDEIDLVVVMDGARHASTAPAFRGGRLICWFSGVDLDLRDATLDPSGAHLEARTAFGGTRIVVAPSTVVTLAGPAIFGGRQLDLDDAAAVGPTLAITGFTVFGGLQVVVAEQGEEIPGWTGEPEPGDGGTEAVPAGT